MNRNTSTLLCSSLAVIATLVCDSLKAQTYLSDSRADEQTRDSEAPFNYFLTPSDALGFMDSPKAFQLTGDGAYSSFWGELTLWAGTPLKRLNSRVRTLDQGSLPIFNYGALIHGIEYRVKSFATQPNSILKVIY